MLTLFPGDSDGAEEETGQPAPCPPATTAAAAGPTAGCPAMEPVAAVLALLWLAGVEAQSSLPAAAFLVRSASWGFTEGEVPPEEVLETISGNTECELKFSIEV